MIKYKNELIKSVNLLADKGYIFIGQSVLWEGTSMYEMIKHLPQAQKIELPVTEELQMGMSAGMALENIKVCSIYPRLDFLIVAMNQLVNHLDKIRIMSDNQFKLKGLIIKTAIGSIKPLFPGEQHSGDYTEGIKNMCKEIKIVKLDSIKKIIPSYQEAVESEVPTILIEIPDLYETDIT